MVWLSCLFIWPKRPLQGMAQLLHLPHKTPVNTCGHLPHPYFCRCCLAIPWVDERCLVGDVGLLDKLDLKQNKDSITQTKLGTLGFSSLPGSHIGGSQPVPFNWYGSYLGDANNCYFLVPDTALLVWKPCIHLLSFQNTWICILGVGLRDLKNI